MGIERFRTTVTAFDELEALIGSPSELVLRKELRELDAHMIDFLAKSPFALLGTVDGNGRCDVSPRGDVPAVAHVLDAKTLVIAERPGNRRADSLRNIIETGRVGLLFLVPGMGETLRVNGRACITRDEDVLAPLAINDRRPVVGIGVEVEECYFQCAKALIRSKLWNESAEPLDSASRHFARMLIDQTHVEGETIESLGQQIEESYRERLY